MIAGGLNMDAKHTPGPWKAMPHTPLSIMGGPDCYVSVADAVELRDKDQAAANARLIAAAPELLAALATLVRRIERDNLHTTAGVRLDAARAVLAKVEGGK